MDLACFVNPHVIGNSLLLYLVMLVLQFLSFEEDNEPRMHVPKSQRSKL
jgi:hypothetical protein